VLLRENLHPYQRRLIEQAATTGSVGLLMEPGLGKTITCLTIIRDHCPGRSLIVAPKRVAETVWAQECEKWEHLAGMRVAKVMGPRRERYMALNSDADVYVINVENLTWLVDSWVPGLFQNLVVDESSRFKDPSTKRFKALRRVLPTFRRKFILTGTPTPQGLGDLWSQVFILDGGERLGKGVTSFRDNYMLPGDRSRRNGVVYNWKPRPGAAAAILNKISDVCFSLRAEDYLQLPTRSVVNHAVPLDDDAAAKYKELKKHLVTNVHGTDITAVSAAALVNKLMQLTSGVMYDLEGAEVEVHGGKLDSLESIVEQSSGPVLVFYNYRSALRRILARFPQAREMDTGTIEAWRRGEVPVMVAHPQSGGIGVNLQCNAGEMAHVVWYDIPWSSESYVQANARVHRQGQTKPVTIHHLLATKTIDEQALMVLEGKINLQDAVLSALDFV